MMLYGFGTLAVRGVVHLQAAATKCALCQTRNVLLGDLFAVGWAAPQAFRVYMRCRNGCWYIAYTHVNATLGKYIATIIMFLTLFVQFGGSDNCSPVHAMRFPQSKRIAWRHDGLGHGDASRKIERYCKIYGKFESYFVWGNLRPLQECRPFANLRSWIKGYFKTIKDMTFMVHSCWAPVPVELEIPKLWKWAGCIPHNVCVYL